MGGPWPPGPCFSKSDPPSWRGGRSCEPQSGKATASNPENHLEGELKAEGNESKFNTQRDPPLSSD